MLTLNAHSVSNIFIILCVFFFDPKPVSFYCKNGRSTKKLTYRKHLPDTMYPISEPGGNTSLDWATPKTTTAKATQMDCIWKGIQSTVTKRGTVLQIWSKCDVRAYKINSSKSKRHFLNQSKSFLKHVAGFFFFMPLTCLLCNMCKLFILKLNLYDTRNSVLTMMVTLMTLIW